MISLRSSLRSLGLTLAALPLVWMSSVAAGAHPLHTTLTQLTYNAAERSVYVSMRVFADDFSTAVARHSGGRAAADHSVADAAAFAYVAEGLTLIGADGRRLPLQWCGARRTDIVLWLCLRSPAPDGLDGLQVHNRVLVEMFEDQINIVQATYNGRKQSLLFTREDRPKRLP